MKIRYPFKSVFAPIDYVMILKNISFGTEPKIMVFKSDNLRSICPMIIFNDKMVTIFWTSKTAGLAFPKI